MRFGAIVAMIAMFVVVGCRGDEKPPQAPEKVVVDNYFGKRVSDPYRYMENMDDTVFLGWMKKQSDYAYRTLAEMPERERLLKTFYEYDSRQSDRVFKLKITENKKYFYLKLGAGEEIAKLYFRNAYDGEEKLLFDPSSYVLEDGKVTALVGFEPSIEGDKVGVFLTVDGSEDYSLIIKDVENDILLPEIIRSVSSSISWMNNGESFIYVKTNSGDIHDMERLRDMKAYFHTVGEFSSYDPLFFSSELYPEVDMCENDIPYISYDRDTEKFYLSLYTVERFEKVYVADAGCYFRDGQLKWSPLILKEDEVQSAYVKGDELYVFTARNTSSFEILKTNVEKPDIAHAEYVLSAPDSGLISGFSFTKAGIYFSAKYHGVEERLFFYEPVSGLVSEIALPGKAGYIAISSLGHKYDELWVIITGWTQESRRYRVGSEHQLIPEALSEEADYDEFDDLIVEELLIKSHDGVDVPLSVIYNKGTDLDGDAPLIITGYGAYGTSMVPYFSPFRLQWNLEGGIIAVAHVRGGGELGEKWRLGGFKHTKPNTWKDLIACVEYLHKHDYSSPKKTVLQSVSAGGILVGMALTERPDLFTAAISQVGIMNPLRMEESPNGVLNVPEFGSRKDSAECMSLLAMDPYFNIEDGKDYPATFITAGFNDARVIVWQPAKFAARLGAAASGADVLLKVDYGSGHGIGDVRSKSLENLVDVMGFGLKEAGHKEFAK